MKQSLLVVCALTVSLGWAAERPARKAAAKAANGEAARTSAAPGAPSIPAGAQEVEPNLFRHVDAKGTAWLYRRTPFGLVKYEEKAVAQRNVVDETVETRATEAGDSIRFDRSGPFGNYSWTRKKSELQPSEKELWERQSQKKALAEQGK